MSPKSKKRLRKRTERCTGCRRRFTPTGYWQHLRQTTKPACITVRDTEARYRPLPSDGSTTSSTSSSEPYSPSRSPSPSPAQSANEHDQDPDLPAQPFEGDYYGDYEAGDFDDFDDFDAAAAMEVDPADSVNDEVEGAMGSGLSGDDGGLGEVELVSGEMGKEGGVVEADIYMSQDDGLEEADDGSGEDEGVQRAGSSEDEEEDREQEDTVEEDADIFEEDGAWEPPPPALPPFNGDLEQDHNSDPDRNDDAAPPTSAGRYHAQERLFHKTFIVRFPGPHAGAPTSGVSTSNLYNQYQRDVDTNGQNPYAPFRSAVDWKVARWAKMRGPGSTAVTELLDIEEVSPLKCRV